MGAHLSPRAQDAVLADLAEGTFGVSWGDERDLDEARRLTERHRGLRMGLVDAAVIATLDLRHFAAVTIPGNPKLLPRDLRRTSCRLERDSPRAGLNATHLVQA